MGIFHQKGTYLNTKNYYAKVIFHTENHHTDMFDKFFLLIVRSTLQRVQILQNFEALQSQQKERIDLYLQHELEYISRTQHFDQYS